jgi:predicted nucleic acid-binding protein
MVLDSNILIYSILPQHQTLRDFIARNAASASAISYVEVVGFHGITDPQRAQFRQLFSTLPLVDIDRPVIDRAVSLRQQCRMSLGDSIIAATALIHDLTLVTRNVADFRWITGLRLLDPIASPPAP